MRASMPLQAMVRHSRPLQVDEVQGEVRPVPQVLRVGELGGVRAEVFEEVVARAGGDHRHGGIGIPGDAVRRLVKGAVPAADIEAQRLPGLRQGAGQGLRGPGAVRQQAGDLQPVGGGQALCHGLEPGGPVPLPGAGVDQKDVLHKPGPPS